jgi:hypothetical protein
MEAVNTNEKKRLGVKHWYKTNGKIRHELHCAGGPNWVIN